MNQEIIVNSQTLKKEDYQVYLICNRIKLGFTKLYFSYSVYGVDRVKIYDPNRVHILSRTDNSHKREAISELYYELEKRVRKLNRSYVRMVG
jgi:hypothetical protein